jgi:hypothetical protein
MLIQVFWNKAIEINSLSNSNKTVFVPFSSDSIIDVYNKYINKIDESNSLLIKGTVENIGGIENSYYESVRRVFSDNNGSTYSFLRFSFFVLCAFEMETSNRYWDLFDKILKAKTTLRLNISDRTSLLDAIIKNLKSYCQYLGQPRPHDLAIQKEFLDLNIYGGDTQRKNVGRIYAHSIFNSKTINSVKTALYELGFAYTIPLESLTIENFEEILDMSGLARIKKLFSNNDSTKELIRECLKLWLINWRPSETEEFKLITKHDTKISGKINVSRIWIDKKNDNKIEWEYGFVTQTKLGNEGKIYLSKEEEIFIDLNNSFKIKENSYLYIIINYHNSKSKQLLSKDLNLSFNPAKNFEGLKSFALQLVSPKNHFANYFLQIDYEKIVFSNEPEISKPIILASIRENNNLHNSNNFIGKFEVVNNSQYFFYRIRDSFSHDGISFIKTNYEIDFSISGSTAGISGKTAFTSSYPIYLKYGNISSGHIEIFNSNNERVYNIDLNNQNTLIDSIDLGLMPVGEYKIKLKNTSGNYEILKSTLDYKSFEIVENGSKERREGEINPNMGNFEFKSITSYSDIQSLNPNWTLLFEKDRSIGKIKTDVLSHQLFDFCFGKNNNEERYINSSRSVFFAAFIDSTLQLRVEEKYDYDTAEYEYIDTDLIINKYKARAVNRGSVSIPMNQEFYVSSSIRGPVFINYYCFELIEMGYDLKAKYGQDLIGKKIYIISNFNEPKFPEKLMKLVTQECFPFKFTSI